ncbi:TetR/AcrR family transcriptional regulator [Photobacterium sp. OFAV2-7]|uniref:TetR/AcrR family transcriptional regulator n=1 Tax=Photobacterium sp. OFAV2-7 TaxID=2917748 RepID=UPI001EF4D2CB|nr:TetR/AcrR family transcriptional regulator [Photobacterium sp. OFAV2-7]MCG7588642.1 TetR/AcrR family transcriptional regulator [Photobacterium sp. OFAV2-7]
MTVSHNVQGICFYWIIMALSDRKRRQFEQREREILDVALELFSQADWESVTIEKIARAADIGKGTIYKHFSSKDEILFRLTMQFENGLFSHLTSDYEIVDDDLLRYMRSIIQGALQYHQHHKQYRYVVEYVHCAAFKERIDHSWFEVMDSLNKRYEEWFGPMLHEAMNRGIITKRSFRDVYIGFYTSLQGSVNMIWAEKDWMMAQPSEHLITIITDFIMAGIIGNPKAQNQ